MAAKAADALIAIIIPCFNQGRFLADALDSVVQQTYTEWECIIVNDGSTDNTESIALSYTTKDKRFKYISQINQGLSNARNTGINVSNGAYIQLLDADDKIEPNKLADNIACYKKTSLVQKKIVYSSMRYFDTQAPDILTILGRNNFIAHVELKESDSLQMQQELVHHRNPFVVSACLYPKQVFNDIGNFDKDLKALEDWDFHIRCLHAGFRFHHHYQETSRTLIRLHDLSMMRNQSLLDESYNKVLSKHHLSVPTSLFVNKKSSLLSKIKRGLNNWL